MIAQIITYGLIIGIFYGLVAVGLSLLFGVMRYMNIAHGSFIVIGGYISFWLFTLWQSIRFSPYRRCSSSCLPSDFSYMRGIFPLEEVRRGAASR